MSFLLLHDVIVCYLPFSPFPFSPFPAFTLDLVIGLLLGVACYYNIPKPSISLLLQSSKPSISLLLQSSQHKFMYYGIWKLQNIWLQVNSDVFVSDMIKSAIVFKRTKNAPHPSHLHNLLKYRMQHHFFVPTGTPPIFLYVIRCNIRKAFTVMLFSYIFIDINEYGDLTVRPSY